MAQSKANGGNLKPGVWVSLLYYAQGLPFSIVRQVSVVFFQDLGASLTALGFTSFYGIPWTFKFLWSPLVDKYSTKRRWLLAMEVGLFAILAFVCVFTQMKADLHLMAALFLVIAVLSATHDIAIDGFYLETLDKSDQAKYSGLQQMGYRLAMLTGTGVLVFIAGKYDWTIAFLLAAAIFAFIFWWNFFVLPVSTNSAVSKASVKFHEGFISFLKLPKIGTAIAFILLFRLGEVVMLGMGLPFLRAAGMSKEQLGIYSGVFGVVATISATMTGGYLISKYGLSKMIVVFGLVQNLAIPIYAAAAFMHPPIWLLAVCVVVEQIANGFGNAAYANFNMRQIHPNFRATHYAIATSFMGLTAMAGGAVSGVIAEKYGYGNLFLFAFAVSIPGMLLLPVIAKRPECQRVPPLSN